MRRKAEIEAEATKCEDLLWFCRTMQEVHDIECHGKPISDEETFDSMMDNVKELEAQYGAENLMPESEFDEGFLNGQLAALRYVLGADWQDDAILDT
jgi:hypothetical protein